MHKVSFWACLSVLTLFYCFNSLPVMGLASASPSEQLSLEDADVSPEYITEADLFFEDSDYQTASPPVFAAYDPYEVVLRIVTSLAIIIIIAFGLSWFLQKKAGIGKNIYGSVLGVLPLDNKRCIYIVDIMGKILILGVTEHNINHLGEITDQNTINSLRIENSSTSMPGMDKLFSFLKKQRHNSIIEDEEQTTQKSSLKTEIEARNHTLKNEERLKKINDLLLKKTNKD